MSPGRLLGHVVFAGLGVLALLFAPERVCYTDSAWQFFLRVNGEGFLFPMGRYGVFFTEIPLFLAVKAGLPLQALIYVFSVSYVAVYYLAWRLCSYVFRHDAAALALVLSLVLGWRHSFLHTVTETHQALVMACVFYGFLGSNLSLKTPLRLAIGSMLALWTCLCHPVGIFMVAFAAAFHAVSTSSLKRPDAYVCVAVCLVPTLFNFLFTAPGYDAQFYNELKRADQLLPQFFQLYPVLFITTRFGSLYWLPTLAAFLAIFLFFQRRQYLLLLAYLGGILLYLVIAVLAFNQGDSDMMMEKTLLPAVFMVSIGFAGQLLAVKRSDISKMALVALLCCTGIRNIWQGCNYYKKRVAFIRQMIERTTMHTGSKYYFYKKDLTSELLLAPWGFGVETLILSNHYYGKSISVFAASDNDPFHQQSQLFVGATFEPHPVSELNPAYFYLDTLPHILLKNPNQ